MSTIFRSSFVRRGIAVMIGSVCLAIGINFFLVPYQLLDGGIIGVSLILNYLWDFKTGLAIIMISVPIFIASWFHNRRYFYYGMHGMLISSLFIDVFSHFQAYFLEHVMTAPLVSSIFGGLLVGLGIGIMLQQGVSTGGTDLLAQLLASIFSINVGVLIFLIDSIVICIGGLFLSSGSLLLSMITILAVGISTSLCTLGRKGL